MEIASLAEQKVKQLTEDLDVVELFISRNFFNEYQKEFFKNFKSEIIEIAKVDTQCLKKLENNSEIITGEYQ